MSGHILSGISPELVREVTQNSVGRRRELVEKACRLAVDRTGISHPVIESAIAMIEGERDYNPSILAEIESLTKKLDNRAWQIQERVEAGLALDQEYECAFSEARAAAAVGLGLSESPDSVLHCLYEAYYAIGDKDAYLRILD